jgi:hypothetical protein
MVVHAPVRSGCPAERARFGVRCLSASLRRSPITGACCWAAFGHGRHNGHGAGGGAVELGYGAGGQWVELSAAGLALEFVRKS